MKCIICEGKYFKTISERVRDSTKHRVVRCKGCGLLQLSPRPSINKDKEFYDQNRQTKNIKGPNNLRLIKKNFLNDTNRRVELVSKYISRGRNLLDIGSGYGFFLQEMDNQGYEITGIETSKERREISSEVTKVKVLNINLFENEADLSKFDCITLFHVLEHINNPISFLRIIQKHLNSDGKLIIEVPNADDMSLGACEKYRNFYWQRAHLFYFNAKTLQKVIQKAGFSIINISYVQRYSIENFMNWVVLGKPQIEKPSFQTKNAYKWLEDYYKKYLCEIGKSDSLILIAKLK